MTYTGSKAQSGRGSTLKIGSTTGVTGVTSSGSPTGMTAGTYPLVFSGGGGSGAAGTITVTSSAVTNIDVTNPGNGYTSAPTVSAATGGTPPTLTATYGDASVEIGECSDTPFTRPEWADVDVTNFDSGNDSEILPVIREPKEFTIKGNRVSSDAGQEAAEAAYQSATLAYFSLTLPKTPSQTTSGDKYTFSAYVKNISFDVSPKKQIEFEMLLKISGAVTPTVGS